MVTLFYDEMTYLSFLISNQGDHHILSIHGQVGFHALVENIATKKTQLLFH